MSKSTNAPSTPDRFNPTTLTLPADLWNRLAVQRQRFENAAVPQNNFRIQVAKYVDCDCREAHWQRLLLEMEAAPSGLDQPEVTVRGSGAAWKAAKGDAIEFGLLSGSAQAVEQFTMLAEATTACLPLEMRPDRPFHSFDCDVLRQSYSPVGSWIEFLFHAISTAGHAGAFEVEINWPKPGCEISTLQMNPLLASVLALDAVLTESSSKSNGGAHAEYDQPKPYLGIEIKGMKVKRRGRKLDSVDFGAKVQRFKLFCQLVDARSEGHTKGELMDAIYDDPKSENALYQLMYAANAVLEPLRIEISVDGRGTWRVIEMPL